MRFGQERQEFDERAADSGAVRRRDLLLRAFAAGGAAFLLASCAYSPGAGPTRGTIVGGGDSDVLPYRLVEIEPGVLAALSAHVEERISDKFVDGKSRAAFTLGPGDILSVTIFDPTVAPLDGEGAGRSSGIVVPAQTLAVDGLVSVPYAGRIKASGRTVQQLQSDIEFALSGKLPNPQIVVTLNQNRSQSVTVSGAVAAPGIFPVSGNGERLLDAIAAAGGTRGPVNDLIVRLTRQNERASIDFALLIDAPEENLRVEPGDLIVVEQETRMFTAIGLTGRVGNFPIDRRRMTVMQALGAAGGVNDEKATPAGVFLYRLESPKVVAALDPNAAAPAAGAATPVVYQLDMQRPESFFLAQTMAIRPNDVLYIAEARSSALFKFLRIIGATTSLIATPATIARP